jgi:hypothetical protein
MRFRFVSLLVVLLGLSDCTSSSTSPKLSVEPLPETLAITIDSSSAYVWDSTLFRVSLPPSTRVPFEVVWQFDSTVVEGHSIDSVRFAFGDTGSHHVACTLKDSSGNVMGTGISTVDIPAFDLAYFQSFTHVSVHFVGDYHIPYQFGSDFELTDPVHWTSLNGRLLGSYSLPNDSSLRIIISQKGIDTIYLIADRGGDWYLGNLTSRTTDVFGSLSSHDIPMAVFQKVTNQFIGSTDSVSTRVVVQYEEVHGHVNDPRTRIWSYDTLRDTLHNNWQSTTKPPRVEISFLK